VLQLWPAGESVTVVEDGLVLREWTTDDVPDLVRLFDTPEMNRRTPLASPFDAPAARLYVQAAHDVRRLRGALHLAITQDGRQPEGEVIIFPTETEGTVELAYGVGEQHADRGLARRAVHTAMRLASAGGASRSTTSPASTSREQPASPSWTFLWWSAAARGRSCTWRSGSALSSRLLPSSRLLFAGATTTTRCQMGVVAVSLRASR